MKRIKKSMRQRFNSYQKRVIAGSLVVLFIVALGIYSLSGSHALSASTSFEPENGTIGGSAAIQADINDSNGALVRFGVKSSVPAGISFAKGMVWQTDDIIGHPGVLDMTNSNVVAAVTQDATDMQAAGVTWNRVWIGPGDSLSELQQVASIYKQHDILMDWEVNSGHGSDPGTESGLTSWLASVVPTMASMGEHFWEIGNEPNINYQAGGYWDTCPGVTPSNATGQGNVPSAVASYVTRLKDGYTTIHQYDSQAFVSSAGLSYDPTYDGLCEIPSYSWTAEFIKPQYNAWNYLDCIGIHPYEHSPSAVASVVTGMRNSFYANASFSSKPVCVTEVGFWAYGYTNQSTGQLYSSDENARAADYTALMDDLKGVNVTTPVFWYNWYDFGLAQGYGIVHYGGYTARVYLPIFYAVKAYQP